MMVKASPIRLLRCCSILCHRGIAESYLRSDDLGGGEKPHKIGSSRVENTVHLDTIVTSCLCFALKLMMLCNAMPMQRNMLQEYVYGVVVQL